MEEKPVTDLIQDEGLQLLSDQQDAEQIQALLEYSQQLNPTQVIEKFDTTFSNTYGGHIPENVKPRIQDHLARVIKWSKLVADNPTRQVNIAHYNNALRELENDLERAKTGAMEQRQRERSRSSHSRSGVPRIPRIRRLVMSKEMSEFLDKQGTQRGVQSMVKSLQAFAKRKGISQEALNQVTSFQFLDQFVARWGPRFKVDSKMSNLQTIKQLVGGYSKQNSDDYWEYSRSVERGEHRRPLHSGQRPSMPDPSKDYRYTKEDRDKPLGSRTIQAGG